MTIRIAAPLAALALVALPAAAAELTPEAVNAADYQGGALPEEQDPVIVRLQTLLDRAGVSPGVIDGYWGENVAAAVMAYEEREGLAPDGALDAEVWAGLTADGAPAIAPYTVTEEDASYPFAAEIPDDWKALAAMERLAYTSMGEMLAERFHMDIDLFEQLNGGLQFGAGDQVLVTQPGEAATANVARIEVSKSRNVVHGFDADGNVVAHYPATVGSDDLPSPTGEHTVEAIAPEPNYTFDPANIPEAEVKEKLIIPPGPNGPVGSMWIDLSEPTYGIHGTSDPSSIGKVASHGCVRLTNWDAEELAGRIEQGVPVVFVD